MADYQQIVDRVRAFVGGTDQTRSDAMSEAATAFATLCEEANTRLRRCVDYLHRGLRSEALNLADCHPALLDVVAALDIPEIEQWEQLCAAYEFTRPGRMMIELAQELNEAYAQHQPLEHLLKRHRLLALSRAPIRERLETLRELAAADPANPCWSEDQETFEAARLRELRTELAAAVRSRNSQEIDHLAGEVLQQPWRIELPNDIKEVTDRISRSVRAERAIHTLNEMIPKMQSAISENSHRQGKDLIEKWRKIVADADLDVPPGLKAEYQSLRTWVQEHDQQEVSQDAFRTAIAELKVAIDTRGPEELLRLRYRAAKDSSYGLPVELEREYHAAISRFNRTRLIERIFIVVMIVGAIGLIVAVLVWGRGHGQH